MSRIEVQLPKKGGLEEATRLLKERKNNRPSPELIKIIEEVTRDEPDRKRDDDVAAMPANKPDIDLGL